MFKISIYGKGGIGKSTISANLAYVIAEKGYRTILMGCDPKHDSTKQLLLNEIVTITEYIADTKPSERCLNDIVCIGKNGVMCMETGGPSPGIGCAGKGIITAFQTLESLKIDSLNPDIVIHDVLGDVVCGGFAIPMRPKHCDVIIIVTSGEPLSLYAANNILRGTLKNNKGCVAGIVLNRKNIRNERLTVESFSTAVGVPIIAEVPNSRRFAYAERKKTPVCELFPKSREKRSISKLADHIISIRKADKLYSPTPLTDVQMDNLIVNGHISTKGQYCTEHPEAFECFPRPCIPKLSPRIGRGPIGGVLEAGKIIDIPVIIHGTRECAFAAINELNLQNMRWGGEIGDNILSTDIGIRESVFGGTDSLEKMLNELVAAGHKTVLVVMSCLPTLTGEDIDGTIERVLQKHPDAKILAIDSGKTNPNYDAHMEVVKAMTEFIDIHEEEIPNTMAIVDDSFIFINSGQNLEYLTKIVKHFGISITHHFLDSCSMDDIRTLKCAEISVLGENREQNETIKRILEGKGLKFMENPLPRGFRETKKWIIELGSTFSKNEIASTLVSEIEERYFDCVNKSKQYISSKKIAVFPNSDENIDWIIETLTDVSAEIFADGKELDGIDPIIGSSKFDKPAIPMPKTSLTHFASIDLLNRVTNAVKSNPSRKWREWGDDS